MIYTPTPEALELAIKRADGLYDDLEELFKADPIDLDQIWIVLEAIRLHVEWNRMMDEMDVDDVEALLGEAIVITGMRPTDDGS